MRQFLVILDSILEQEGNQINQVFAQKLEIYLKSKSVNSNQNATHFCSSIQTFKHPIKGQVPFSDL